MRSSLVRRRRLMLIRRPSGSTVLGRNLARRVVCTPRLLRRRRRVLHRSWTRNVPRPRSRLVRIVAGSRDVRRRSRRLVVLRRTRNRPGVT